MNHKSPPPIRRRILELAEKAFPNPYKPGEYQRDGLKLLVADGLLEPCQMGGFALSEKGRRELARYRAN